MDFPNIYTYATRIAVIKTGSMSFYKPPTRVAKFKKDSYIYSTLFGSQNVFSTFLQG